LYTSEDERNGSENNPYYTKFRMPMTVITNLGMDLRYEQWRPRICCKEGQSWRSCHEALTADFRAGCSRLLDD